MRLFGIAAIIVSLCFAVNTGIVAAGFWKKWSQDRYIDADLLVYGTDGNMSWAGFEAGCRVTPWLMKAFCHIPDFEVIRIAHLLSERDV